MRRCRVCGDLVPGDALKQEICLGCRREYSQFFERTFADRFNLDNARRWAGHVKAARKLRKRAPKPNTEWLNGRAAAGRNNRHVPERRKPDTSDVEKATASLEEYLGSFEDRPIGDLGH